MAILVEPQREGGAFAADGGGLAGTGFESGARERRFQLLGDAFDSVADRALRLALNQDFRLGLANWGVVSGGRG